MARLRQPLRLADVGEQGVLQRLMQRIGRTVPRASSHVVLGIGDDGAVLRVPAGHHVVVSTDVLVEDVDFACGWASHAQIGHKAAAVNLSDLAAMGARPLGLVIALSASAEARVHAIVTLLATAHRVGALAGAPLVGGDLSRTRGPLSVAVTAIGSVQPNHLLRRDQGQPGDVVLVSGTLGAAAAGLWWLQHGQRNKTHARVSQKWVRALQHRQLTPTAQTALGIALAKSGLCHSAADISDGIFKDAGHVAAPGCIAELCLDQLPLAPGVMETAHLMGVPAWQLAGMGGEDFELVLAVPKRNVGRILRLGKRLAIDMTPIGTIRRAPARTTTQKHGGNRVRVIDAHGHVVADHGLRAFEHFTRS